MNGGITSVSAVSTTSPPCWTASAKSTFVRTGPPSRLQVMTSYSGSPCAPTAVPKIRTGMLSSKG
ncbi:hypothetical protein ACFXJ8_15295 [Nonomuraea sp. NPDC059194]|uniref:hypothetical protein n=1 Tax=Nonomuraea sp. NPDC059194 TaxID=3346764 RepID=UPI0036BE419F